MDISAFELGERLNNRKIEYIVHRELWTQFNYPNINFDFSEWSVIKYLNEDATSLNEQINNVPDDKGGLYLFFIKCPIITGMTEYPLYIGRAQLTDGQNLRKRTKEYFQKYSRNNERPKITKMFNYWAKDLFLAFFPLEENETIINVERDIINSLVLPLNDQIPDKIIKEAIKAFEQ
jgi:hypothetical protein